jgi:hypothetical protein
MSRRWWRILAKALGEKAHSDDRLADQVAAIRVAILLGYMVTNAFICAGVVRHWND